MYLQNTKPLAKNSGLIEAEVPRGYVVKATGQIKCGDLLYSGESKSWSPAIPVHYGRNAKIYVVCTPVNRV